MVNEPVELNQSPAELETKAEIEIKAGAESGFSQSPVSSKVEFGAEDVSGDENLAPTQQATVSYKIRELENLAQSNPEQALEKFLEMLESSEEMGSCSQEDLRKIIENVKSIQSALENAPKGSKSWKHNVWEQLKETYLDPEEQRMERLQETQVGLRKLVEEEVEEGNLGVVHADGEVDDALSDIKSKVIGFAGAGYKKVQERMENFYEQLSGFGLDAKVTKKEEDAPTVFSLSLPEIYGQIGLGELLNLNLINLLQDFKVRPEAFNKQSMFAVGRNVSEVEEVMNSLFPKQEPISEAAPLPSCRAFFSRTASLESQRTIHL
jgi:hypothetical protein